MAERVHRIVPGELEAGADIVRMQAIMALAVRKVLKVIESLEPLMKKPDIIHILEQPKDRILIKLRECSMEQEPKLLIQTAAEQTVIKPAAKQRKKR